MAKSPRGSARPVITLIFDLDTPFDASNLCLKLEFRGMLNGGYIIRACIGDPNFNMMDTLIQNGYLAKSRTKELVMRFKIEWEDASGGSDSATKEQIAIVTSFEGHGGAADVGDLEFIAVDPASWFLNKGKGSGKCYKGRVDQAVHQVVQEYAPNINLSMTETTDSKDGKWYMLRQNPQAFINSLLEWSPAITKKKTNLLVSMDGYNLTIQEQAEIVSRKRGYYTYWGLGEKDKHDSIASWDIIADNSLSLTQTKIITHGISTISGQYFDNIAVSDDNTHNKQMARVDKDQSFAKPSKDAGCSSVRSIPEIYSAGELGLPYSEYIDGIARNNWLNLMYKLFRIKIRVLGHGEWSDCTGLGVDTVYLNWTKSKKNDNLMDNDRFFFTAGNWIVYGFQHVVSRKGWFTDLYCSRLDSDSAGQKVPTI